MASNLIQTQVHFGNMLKRTYAIAILTVATLGAIPLSAQATDPCCKRTSGDNAVIQTSEQQAHVTGSHNSIRQRSSQTSASRSPRKGNQGTVQEQFQDGNGSGHGNRVSQSNRQNSNSRNSRNTPKKGHAPSPAPICYDPCANKSNSI